MIVYHKAICVIEAFSMRKKTGILQTGRNLKIRIAENHLRREKRLGMSFGGWEKEGRGREVPTQARVLSPGLDWSTGRPSIGRLETAH